MNPNWMSTPRRTDRRSQRDVVFGFDSQLLGIHTVSCLPYSTLKMEAMCSSETSVYLQRITGVVTQKVVLFITTSVRTSNPTYLWNWLWIKKLSRFSLLSLFWKNKSWLMRSPCCVSMNSLLSIFECLSQSLWNYVSTLWYLSLSHRRTS
jgi:hypothetical protein